MTRLEHANNALDPIDLPAIGRGMFGSNRSSSGSAFKRYRWRELASELGEIERVASLFDPMNRYRFIYRFVKRLLPAAPVELPDRLWQRLDNSDSYQIARGDWDAVAYHAHGDGRSPRDWHGLRRSLEDGRAVNAPIIVMIRNALHLVSGNTRLMVARALELRPRVILVEMSEYSSSPAPAGLSITHPV